MYDYVIRITAKPEHANSDAKYEALRVTYLQVRKGSDVGKLLDELVGVCRQHDGGDVNANL